MRRRDHNTRLSGLNWLEESFHALRAVPAGTLLCYYVGAAPFVLGMLFFWSDMSRSGHAEKHLIGGVIGLSMLFIWMKVWQSVFAAKMSAQIAQEPPPKITFAMLWHAAATQALIHSTGLILIPVAAQILVPVVWTFNFYQSATVFALREPTLGALARRSWRQARWAVLPAHTALIVLFLFSLFVFLNVGIAIIAGPHLVKALLGVESNSTLSFMSSLNTTFLAAAAGVTYLCVDPLVKTFYALRCFYGEARTTGEDLRVTLRGFRTTTALALALLFLALAPVGFAADKTVSPTTAQGTELDRSIERVLERPEYTWREARPKNASKSSFGETALGQRVSAWVKRTLKSIRDWLDGLGRSNRGTGGGFRFPFTTENLIYILIAVLVVVIGVLGWWIWRTRSRSARAELEATPAAPMPNLETDDVAGDELPVDGWTALALELLERGELRLAMRAFYLSSLAHLAGRNLVRLAKFKSNRDYERELLRRSHALPGLARTFSDTISVFDRVWYGRHDIDREQLQQFRTGVERIREC